MQSRAASGRRDQTKIKQGGRAMFRPPFLRMAREVRWRQP